MKITDKLKSIFGLNRPQVKINRDSAYNTGGKSLIDSYNDLTSVRPTTRQEKYDIYDSMDLMPDVSSILDAYAEDCTQIDRNQESTVWIEGSDKNTVRELTDLLKRINIEEFIFSLSRDTGKYGDDFAKVIANNKNGVEALQWWDPRDIERIESLEGTLLGFERINNLDDYHKKLSNSKNAAPTYKPWDFIHWRIYKEKRLYNEKFKNIYGTSLLAKSPQIAKKVQILDDLLMIIRLTKSLDRRIYYVDTGRSTVEEEVKILKRWKRALKRKTYVDPSANRFDSRFNPYSYSEDEFWPKRDNSESRIENIPGIGNVTDMVDIDHFRNKFFGSFSGAPKAYFGYEGDINTKGTLSSQSLRWARSVANLQRSVKLGLTRLCLIHLALKDRDVDQDKFRVMMVEPSVLELLDRLETWQVIVDVAQALANLGETLQLDRVEWTNYILENTLWLPKQEVKKLLLKKERSVKKEPIQKPEEIPNEESEEPEEDNTELGFEEPEEDKDIEKLDIITEAIDKLVP